MTSAYKAILAQMAPGTNPRHILALLQSRDGRNALDDPNPDGAGGLLRRHGEGQH